jgi:hypothetical protein
MNSGRPQWFRLDTGCASTLQYVTRTVVTNRCSAKAAVGLTTLAVPQTHTTVSLAGERFEKVPTGLHRRPIFPGEAGLLGLGFLARFPSVTIDTKAARLVLGRSSTALTLSAQEHPSIRPLASNRTDPL